MTSTDAVVHGCPALVERACLENDRIWESLSAELEAAKCSIGDLIDAGNVLHGDGWRFTNAASLLGKKFPCDVSI